MNRAIGMVRATNSAPATTYGVKLKSSAVSIWAARMASMTPEHAIRPESFCSETRSFISGGTTRRTAWGSTTWRRVWRVAEAERAGGGPLRRVHRLDAGPEDLGDVGRVGQHERGGAPERRAESAGPAGAGRARRSRARKQHEQQRQPAEQVDVGRGEQPQREEHRPAQGAHDGQESGRRRR